MNQSTKVPQITLPHFYTIKNGRRITKMVSFNAIVNIVEGATDPYFDFLELSEGTMDTELRLLSLHIPVKYLKMENIGPLPYAYLRAGWGII